MLDLRSLSITAGAFALDDVTFSVPAGAYGVVIGPAGAGKTTLLEAIAGLRAGARGSVWVGGEDVSRRPPEERGVGLVYQHAFLFPHLSVEANAAYGAGDAAGAERARALLARFGVADLARRRVDTLSGGERQLVALARALASRPRLLLLDEPFGALDPARRRAVRATVRGLQREWGLTTLHVTHDFDEAGVLGDVLVVLEGGRVRQVGAPAEVFRRPASPAVAAFLGAENVFAGVVRAVAGGRPPSGGAEPGLLVVDVGPITLHAVGEREPGAVHVVMRADDVVIERPAAGDAAERPTSARNAFRGRVVERAGAGAVTHVTLDVAGLPLVAALTTRSADELGLRAGDEVVARVKALAVHLC
ncbi:MAG: ATP-binding cassette domain-containing protein [Gemmatimonadaceae bacterium]